MKTIDAASGKWADILPAFGIAPEVLRSGNKHFCCPVTGEGKDRFRFSNQNGSGSYFCTCSPDGRKGGMGLLQCKTGRDFADLAREVDRMIGNTHENVERPDRKDPMPLLRAVQNRAQSAGFNVRQYLEARGLICPPTVREIHELEYWHDGAIAARFPAMAAKIVDQQGKPQSWHITYVQHGKKAPVEVPRKVLPPITSITGCAVRLFPVAAHIGIAEGIETAIAAHMLHSLPVWSVISRGGLESFLPPPEVKAVTIFGDVDRSFAGQAGAFKAAERLHRLKISVDVRLPEEGDWNDKLRVSQL